MSTEAYWIQSLETSTGALLVEWRGWNWSGLKRAEKKHNGRQYRQRFGDIFSFCHLLDEALGKFIFSASNVSSCKKGLVIGML